MIPIPGGIPSNAANYAEFVDRFGAVVDAFTSQLHLIGRRAFGLEVSCALDSERCITSVELRGVWIDGEVSARQFIDVRADHVSSVTASNARRWQGRTYVARTIRDAVRTYAYDSAARSGYYPNLTPTAAAEPSRSAPGAEPAGSGSAAASPSVATAA